MQKPRPFFQFSFPRSDVVDSFMTNVANLYTFYDLLKQMWQADDSFKKFKWPIKLNTEKSGNYVVIRCVKRCRFMIKLSRVSDSNRIMFKIDVLNNVHNHFFMEYTQEYRQKTGERGLEIKMTLNQKYVANLHTPKTELYGENPRNSKKKLKQTAQLLQNKRIIQQDNPNESVQLFRIHQFFKKRQQLNQKRRQQLKDEIISNALVKFDEQEDGSKSFVFYSSNSMAENFRKWGKSVVVVSVKCRKPEVPNFFLKSIIGISKKSQAFIFCGCNNEMQIAIFSIGIMTTNRKTTESDYFNFKKKVIQHFLDLPSSKNIETMILYEHQKQLIRIFDSFSKTNTFCNYTIKLKLQKFYNVYRSSEKHSYTDNAGIIFKLAYNNVFGNLYPHLKNEAKYYNLEILNAISRKAKQIEPYITKLCLVLDERSFGYLLNKYIGKFCTQPIHFMTFKQEFLENRDKYCLIQIENYEIRHRGQVIDRNSNIDQNNSKQYKKQNIKQNETVNENQPIHRADNKMVAECIDHQSQNIAQIQSSSSRFKNVGSNNYFEKQGLNSAQTVNKNEKKSGEFIGLNMLVNFQGWLADRINSYNLNERIAQTLFREQKNLEQNPKTCSELFFREILLMLNESKFLFDPPEQKFWENIGFNVYESEEEVEISDYEEPIQTPSFYDPKTLPSRIPLKCDWEREIIRYSSSISVKYEITSKYEKMLGKLPYYKMSQVHMSKAAHQLIMTYQLMEMLKYNCSEQELYLDAAQGPSNLRTFIVGSHHEVFFVWKIQNKAWKCSCLFKHYMGMPCRHILKAIVASDSRFSESMLDFWKVQVKEGLPPIW